MAPAPTAGQSHATTRHRPTREISSRSPNDNRNADRTGSRAGGRRINRKRFASHITAALPDLLRDQTRSVEPCAANSAIRHRSNSDNRSDITAPPDRSNSIESRDALIP